MTIESSSIRHFLNSKRFAPIDFSTLPHTTDHPYPFSPVICCKTFRLLYEFHTKVVSGKRLAVKLQYRLILNISTISKKTIPESPLPGNDSERMATIVTTTGSMSQAIQNDDWFALLKQHEPWLRKVLFNRVGDADVVDDLMQEIGLAISRPELRPSDINRLGAWLYRVAVKQSYLYRRKMGRYRRYVSGGDEAVESAEGKDQPDPLQWLMGREHQQAVQKCLKTLGDTDREILMLKYGENWTYQQLADRLGVTVHTIEHRLIKAKKRLRQLLHQANIEVVGSA